MQCAVPRRALQAARRNARARRRESRTAGLDRSRRTAWSAALRRRQAARHAPRTSHACAANRSRYGYAPRSAWADPRSVGNPDRLARATACRDRKSTRLNSSHSSISYAVFCLKKKKKERQETEKRKYNESI